VRDGELRDEAYDGDAVAADDPERAYLGQVGAPGPDEGDDCGEDVYWNCQELGVCTGVTEPIDDGGDCCSESAGVSIRDPSR
jgi:hypothetical protein